MAIHDAYARRTPYEVAFPDPTTAEDWMDRIREGAGGDEAESALRDPGRFLSLPSVARVVHEMREPGAGGEEVQKHAILLFHAFHFHEAGRFVLFLETGAVRYLVETDQSATGPGGGSPDPPASAGYLQLPRQLFWMSPVEEGRPEPVDGMFWTVPDGERLSLLVVGGMREDRPGFSVVPLPPVPVSDAEVWLRSRVRESGPDFETTLPGGELERLYSIEAAGEVLKLAARTFRYVDGHPGAVVGEEGGPGPVDEETDGPRPTVLPYRRVHLEDQDSAAEAPGRRPAKPEVPTTSDRNAAGTADFDDEDEEERKET